MSRGENLAGILAIVATLTHHPIVAVFCLVIQLSHVMSVDRKR